MRCSSEPPSSRLRLLDGGIVAVVGIARYDFVVVGVVARLHVLGRGEARAVEGKTPHCAHASRPNSKFMITSRDATAPLS